MYRRGPQPAASAPEGGLVEDVIAQFADRFAYARELVQNSIDAGASAIEVRIEDEAEGLAVSFQDDGAGMTLEVVQGPLLTIFSSTKEGVAGKIGRYGIGFKSVLAVDPTLVIVDTHRPEGSYRVRLSRDHSFEITEAEPRPGSGTRVTLLLALSPEERVLHRQKLATALHGWCRYVRCPITLVTQEGTRCVNVPFELAAAVTVELEEDGVRAIVGPAQGRLQDGVEGNVELAGFYCHGLTLLEVYAGDTVRPGLRYRLESPGLSCTASRDDVRRDAHFRAAMRLVERAEKRLLPDAIDAALEREASLSSSDVARASAYLSLLAVAIPRRPASSVRVALLEPYDGKSTIAASDLLDLATDGRAAREFASSAFSRALARRGLCVIRAFEGSDIGRVLGIGFGDPRQRFALVMERPGAARVRPLLDALRSVLGRAGRPVEELVLVRRDCGEWLGQSLFVHPEEATRDGERRSWLLPARGGRGRNVLLLQASAILDAAAACRSVPRAASLLARLVLLEDQGALTPALSDALLAEALEVL